MFSKGSLTIGRFRGAPIRVHWSTPIGLFVFAGFRFAPGAWIGFVLLVLLHELGHAAVVAACRHRVIAAEVYALGGLCHWDGRATPLQRALIAWGGVLAQLLAGVAVLVAVALFGRPGQPFAADLVDTFLRTNLWLCLLNLVPLPPLDGAEAWRIVPILAQRRRQRREAARLRKRPELDDPEELEPMPDEVKRVLERVTAQSRAMHQADKKSK